MDAGESPPSADRAGVLIVGHGTRDRRGLAEFDQVVGEVAALLPRHIVEGCYLELVAPNVAEGIQRMHERGVRRLTVMPLLLVAAGHARRDIPAQLARGRARFPELSITCAPHLGCRELVLQLSEQRFREALQSRATVASEDTVLVFVGRGTNDAAANEELCAFAHRRTARTPVGRLQTCFLAMAEPSLSATFELALRSDVRRVVVQPHLLFQGELLDRIRTMVADATASQHGRELVVTDRLGPHALLARAVIEAMAEAPAVTVMTPLRVPS